MITQASLQGPAIRAVLCEGTSAVTGMRSLQLVLLYRYSGWHSDGDTGAGTVIGTLYGVSPVDISVYGGYTATGKLH